MSDDKKQQRKKMQLAETAIMYWLTTVGTSSENELNLLDEFAFEFGMPELFRLTQDRMTKENRRVSLSKKRGMAKMEVMP